MVPAKLSTGIIHYDRNLLAEYPGEYDSLGYHPVHIGDSFNNGRYKVVNKLGHSNTTRQTYVALKILTTAAPINPFEIELPTILNALECNEGYEYILTPSDAFDIQGPNGYHKCLVLPVVGPSIHDYSENVEPWYLPLKVAKRAILETVKGMGYLHRNGIGHGDLHIGNILLQIPGLKSWNDQQILSHFGKPVRDKFQRLDGLPVEPSPGIPQYIVEASHVTKPLNFDGSIMIADFSSAFRSSRGAKCLPTSVNSAACAPEIILGYPFDLPSDIWSLGCTIFAIVSGLEPFGNIMCGKNSILLEILWTLGKPSEPWWTQCPEAVRELGEVDQGVMKAAIIRRSLAERITEISLGNVDKGEDVDLMPVRKGEFSDNDIEGMVDLLSRMLVYEPEKRLTASEVLAHPWMKSL
ncbi:hypothetical protein MMC30_006207 [Trapelia coarctata]|nr:hypothetical protein [Trapelia coarctata]